MSRDLVPVAGGDAAVRAQFAALAAARHAEQNALHDDADPWGQADALAEQWLRSEAFTEGTRGQYRAVWEAWRTWLVMTDVPPFAALRSDVDAYALALARHGNPAAQRPQPLGRGTVARHLSSISSYYNRAVEDQLTDRNPVPRRRHKVRQDSKQPYLAPDEIRAIIAAADAYSPRASALVALLLLVCVRTSEALTVRIEHIRYEGGHRFVHVVKKGGVRARTAIPPQAWVRIATAIGDRREGPIICGQQGQPISRKTAWQLVGRLGRLAGVEAQIGGHTLRHAAITRGHELGLPLDTLQDLAAHADPKTTRGYDRSKFDPTRNAAFKIAADLAGDDQSEEGPNP